MHVEDVEDICMQCNTMYCTLNDKHVEDVGDDKNTYYVDFWTSNDWFMGGACGLDLISQNQRCRALSTWGRKDSRLRFWLSTLPASTILLILPLCFFHVDSVDWLMLNLLQTSTAFKPLSNLPSISIFSFSVLSVCWRLGFDTDILNANTQIERNTEFLYDFECIYFACRRCRRLHQRYMKESIYFSYKMSKTLKMEGKPHSIHERRRRRWRLHQRYMKESIYFSYKNVEDVEDGRKTTYNTWKTLTVASFLNSK